MIAGAHLGWTGCHHDSQFTSTCLLIPSRGTTLACMPGWVSLLKHESPTEVTKCKQAPSIPAIPGALLALLIPGIYPVTRAERAVGALVELALVILLTLQFLAPVELIVASVACPSLRSVLVNARLLRRLLLACVRRRITTHQAHEHVHAHTFMCCASADNTCCHQAAS